MSLWTLALEGKILYDPPRTEHSLFEYPLEFIDQEWNWREICENNKAFLVVNTATGCGFHQQLKELQQLFDRYKDLGLIVIAIPSPDFMGQETRDGEELVSYCQIEYGSTYPITYKTHVKTDPVEPLFQWLNQLQTPIWNYQKYLFNKKGHCVAIASPLNSPSTLEEQIIKIIQETDKIP